MSTVAIPLSKLRLSEQNVRHPQDGDVALQVHDLQASILSVGLLSPLIVHDLKKPKGHYGVLAGGRRLRALQGLATDGRIDKDLLVDCIVRNEDLAKATELSIAENVVRVALKPTTEFQAFAQLADDGASEEEIAERFATTIVHVRQRMRLGRLHPEILAALDEGKISLDAGKAYASTEDQALQFRVFSEMSAGHHHWPNNIRNAIRGGASAYNTEAMLEVVGAEAYHAAGGALEEDLFAGGFRVIHPGTLADLYYAKVDEQTAALSAELPERVTFTTSGTGLGRYVHIERSLDEQQAARIAAIDERLTAIDDALADAVQPDTPEAQALTAEETALQDERDAIESDARPELPEGPLVAHFEPGRNAPTVRAWYRPNGWVDPAAAEGAAPHVAGGAAPAASLDKPIGLDSRIGYGDPKPAVKAEHGLTADAIEAMRTHRRAILRGMMVDAGGQSWSVAAAALPFMTLRHLLGASGRSYGMRGVSAAELGAAQGAFNTASGPVIALSSPEEFKAQPCSERWTDTLAYIEGLEWMTEPDLRRAFALFVAAPENQRDLAGAVAAGLLLDRSLNAPGYRVPLHDELAALMGLAESEEVREQWTPDEAFFLRLPKSRRIAAVEAISPGVAKEIGKLPNDETAKVCALFFSGSEEARRRWRLTPSQVALTRRWVPPFLAFAEDSGKPRVMDVMRAEGEVAS